MFQYAFAKASSKRLGVEFALDLSDKTLNIHQGYELNRVFGLQAKIATTRDLNSLLGVSRFTLICRIFKTLGFGKYLNANLIKEPSFKFSHNMLMGSDNKYYDGYWQSEKYFIDASTQIRNDFTFANPLDVINSEIVNKMQLSNSVSIHIRRGDYVQNPKVAEVHAMATMDYYKAAIEHIAENISSPHFFIFSDDITWVKSNLILDYQHEYVDHNRGENSFNDMRLMSACKHNIIANSSFSWWSAWLNANQEKIIIAPKNWFKNNTSTEDLIPESWITL